MTPPRRIIDDVGIPDPGAARHLMTASVDRQPIKVVEVSGIRNRNVEIAFFYEPTTGRLLYFGDDPADHVSGRWTTAEPLDAEPLETDEVHAGDVPAWLLGDVEVREAPQPRRERERYDEARRSLSEISMDGAGDDPILIARPAVPADIDTMSAEDLIDFCADHNIDFPEIPDLDPSHTDNGRAVFEVKMRQVIRDEIANGRWPRPGIEGLDQGAQESVVRIVDRLLAE